MSDLPGWITAIGTMALVSRILAIVAIYRQMRW